MCYLQAIRCKVKTNLLKATHERLLERSEVKMLKGARQFSVKFSQDRQKLWPLPHLVRLHWISVFMTMTAMQKHGGWKESVAAAVDDQ